MNGIGDFFFPNVRHGDVGLTIAAGREGAVADGAAPAVVRSAERDAVVRWAVHAESTAVALAHNGGID